MALRLVGIPPLQIRIDGSIFRRYQHPTRFASPRRRGDDGLEILSGVEHLRSRHKRGLLARKIGREVFVKLRGVEISETVCRFLYRGRFAEITGKTLSIVGFILSRIRH